MTYIVHVTAVVEGDLERIEELINEYRYNCLENQPGMKGFYVCRPADHPNIFLYTQIFKDIRAHRAHIEGDDPVSFLPRWKRKVLSSRGAGWPEKKSTPFRMGRYSIDPLALVFAPSTLALLGLNSNLKSLYERLNNPLNIL